MKYLTWFLLLSLSSTIFSQMTFDIQGHRGCRGLYPENSVVAFIEAVKLGVNTLELDVVVSKDGQLVVSHEPWMSPAICLFPEGQPSEEDARQTANIYKMTYEEIGRYDCGTRNHPKFREQKKMFAPKPLLSEVIDSVEIYIRQNHLTPVQYNIETKSTPDGDDVYHPKPDVFAKLLYDLLKHKSILSKCIIQSFDPRTLKAVHQIDSLVTTALLVADIDSFEKNVEHLGFTPPIYSPNFILVTDKMIKKCHRKNVKVIPWTVNDEDKMLKLKSMGVDGIITDYPDRAIKVLRK